MPLEDLSEQVKQCLKRWGREPGIRIKAAGSSLDFGTIERKRESGQSQVGAGFTRLFRGISWIFHGVSMVLR